MCRNCLQRDLRIKQLERLLQTISKEVDKANTEITKLKAMLFSKNISKKPAEVK